MLRVLLPHAGYRGFFALTLGGALLVSAGLARAADFEDDYRYAPPRGYYDQRGPVYAPPPYSPPLVERRVEVEEAGCRVLHRRELDPYGREVVRRVRVCDEGIVARSPNYGYVPGYQERRYHDVPRPPRGVGSGYEDEPY